MLCIQRTSSGEGQLSTCFVLGSHKLHELYFSLTIDMYLHCAVLSISFFTSLCVFLHMADLLNIILWWPLKANIHYATFHATSCMQPVARN